MELVQNRNGKLVTTSLKVAEKFGKEHRHVLTAIDEIVKGYAENSADLFEEAEYIHPQNNQSYRMYIMNEDGFSLVVMGFTGKKAMKFKMDYVNEFRRMRETIEKQSFRPLSQLEILQQSTQILIEQDKRIGTLENKIEVIEAQTKTRPDYFSIVGYASLHKIPCPLPVASRLGRAASKICRDNDIPTDSMPDPRFGEVKLYPLYVLKNVFNHTPIN